MTKLGEFLEKKSVNKAGIARKTGISKNRISQLSINNSTVLSVEELYLIALAMDISPYDILDFVCEDLKLKEE